jgi:hypothetical protein
LPVVLGLRLDFDLAKVRARLERVQNAQLASKIAPVQQQSQSTYRDLLRAGVVVASVTLLLAVTLAQAADFCQLSGTHPQVRSDAQAGSGSRVCPICAIAHSPVLISPSVSVAPEPGPTETASVQPVSFRSVLQAFALCVRPPPSV